MSPVNNQFGAAVEGTTAETADVAAVIVMGKDLGSPAANEVGAHIARFAAERVARPVNMLTASTKATPGGGLEPTGDEDVTYVNKAGGMFGFDDDAVPGVKAP